MIRADELLRNADLARVRVCVRVYVGRSLDPLPWRFFCFCCCFFFFVFLRRARRVNDTRPEQIPNGSLRAFHFPAVRAASLSPSLSPLRPPPASPARRPRRSYAPSRRFVPVHAHPATTITSSIFIQERTSSRAESYTRQREREVSFTSIVLESETLGRSMNPSFREVLI